MRKMIEDVVHLLYYYNYRILLETIPIYNKMIQAKREWVSAEELKRILLGETFSKVMYEERDGKIMGENRVIITIEYDGYYKEATAYSKGGF